MARTLNDGFGKRKNVQRLLEAFAVVRKARPGAVLRLAGADFEIGGPAQEYATQRGLGHGVEFLGPIPATEVPAFMRSLDVLVHPSLEESFGMTLLEEIIEGTPVIAGRNSGAVPWELGKGQGGTLVDIMNAE